MKAKQGWSDPTRYSWLEENCQELQSDIPSKKIVFQQNCDTLHLGLLFLFV